MKAPRSSIFLRDLQDIEVSSKTQDDDCKLLLDEHCVTLTDASTCIGVCNNRGTSSSVDDDDIPLDEKMRMLSSELLDKSSRLEAIDRMLDMCDAPHLDDMLYPSQNQKERRRRRSTIRM